MIPNSSAIMATGMQAMPTAARTPLQARNGARSTTGGPAVVAVLPWLAVDGAADNEKEEH
jgi:hypothetical protein